MHPCLAMSYVWEWLPDEMIPVRADHGWHWLELGEEHGHDLFAGGTAGEE